MRAITMAAILGPRLAAAAILAERSAPPTAPGTVSVPTGRSSPATAGSAGTAATASTLAAAAAPPGYSLAFAEEFDGTALDRSRW